MIENEVSRVIYEKAIEVRKILAGPGLLESVYEEAFAWELNVLREKLWVSAFAGMTMGRDCAHF